MERRRRGAEEQRRRGGEENRGAALPAPHRQFCTSAPRRVCFSALLHLSSAPPLPCSSSPLLSIYLDAIFFKCSRVKIESLRF